MLFGVFNILNLVWFVGILKHVKRSMAKSGDGHQSDEGGPLLKEKAKGYDTMKPRKNLEQ